MPNNSTLYVAISSNELAMTADNYHEERLTVVVNKLYVADQKICAEEIVKRCRENSFKSVRFSYNQSIPNALTILYVSSLSSGK